MGIHSITRYITYRLTAKGKHGTHSPFVYALVDDCLLKTNGLPLHKRLTRYFDKDTVISLSEVEPRNWLDMMHRHASPSCVIIIPHIHLTPLHTAQWENIAGKSAVKMSIDLYKYGVLLFRNDFKEKQHFVLKAI